MNKLRPLKSSLGQPAEGADKYFLREKIIKKILRQLNKGENLLLSAPRRIGKSSILKHIKKNPQDNQIILYIAVQSVDSSEEFFKKLFNELIKNKEVFEGISGYFSKTTSHLRLYAKRITGFSLTGSVKINPDENIDYYTECTRLFEDFDKNHKELIIFIDEFPDTLNNILEKDKSLAISFLQQNRDLRLNFSASKLQFVYTGSTGLNNVVKKLNKLDLVNDIHSIKISPFTREEAKELIQCLTLGLKEENSEFEINNSTMEYILDKISWRLPYYMQIIVHELFEYFEDEEQVIENTTVDFVLSEIVKSKSNHSDYFENWKRRLKISFQNQDYDFAINVLNHIAKNERIEYSEFFDLSVKYSIEEPRYILDVLEYDGYISEDNKVYGFNSFLLKEWWYINVAT